MKGTQKKYKTETPSEGSEIVNIRIPKDLILGIDELVKKRIFNSRSEAIREFAREYVQEQTHERNAKVSERGGRGW